MAAHSRPNRAVPTPEETAFVKAWWARKAQEQDEPAPSFIATAALRVATTLFAPCAWALCWVAGRKQVEAAQREEAKEADWVALPPPPQDALPADLNRWRLHCHKGRQIWAYEEGGAGTEQDRVSAVQLGSAVPTEEAAADVDDAVSRACEYVKGIQSPEDGHWANDYGGPLFLLPGAVITKYILHRGDQERMFPAAHRRELVRYLRNVQNPDGGWGLNEQGLSTLFGTVLNYVAMRMIGVDADDERVASARAFLRRHGGATLVPTWGKAWLCLANLYKWEGLKPVTPELWLLPKWLPIHPSRMWCHTRQVYIPLGYLFGTKYQAPLDPLLEALRGEIFVEEGGFAVVDWAKAYGSVAPLDLHYPTHPVALAAFALLRLYEKVAVPFLRRWALAECVSHMEYDDCSTNFICLGPVNKCFNLVAMYAHEGWTDHVRLSEARLADYFSMGPSGMKFAGYNGSQLWDTAFALQAYRAAGVSDDEDYRATVAAGLRYIACAQVLETPPCARRFNRADPYGGWNFSTAEQGWQVSDCTAEGLRCAILFEALPEARIRAGVDQLLLLRNPDSPDDDGAWCSYEARRSPVWLELLNPADVFSRIMVEYSYTECSSASLQTLVAFKRSKYWDEETYGARVAVAMRCAVQHIKQAQYAHGGWYGSWGVCFTYGTMFALEGLVTCGEPRSSEIIRRGVDFLVGKQRADGGWSEHVMSCATRTYIEAGGEASLPVQTSWALLGLLAAAADVASTPPAHLRAMERAATFLVEGQRGGTWKQYAINGVFNGTCGIHYHQYPTMFPFWALAKYRQFRAGRVVDGH